jgi:hypothetical protein
MNLATNTTRTSGRDASVRLTSRPQLHLRTPLVTLWAAAAALSLVPGCSDALSSGVAASSGATVIPEDEAELRNRIDKVRAVNLRRYMNTREHAAWQIIHGILAYQDQLKVDHITIDQATKAQQKNREPALKLILEGGQVRGFTVERRHPEILFELHGSDSRQQANERLKTRRFTTTSRPTEEQRLVGQWVLAEATGNGGPELETLREKVRELDTAVPAYMPADQLKPAVTAAKLSVVRDSQTLATVVEGGSKAGQGHPNQWLGYLLVDYPPPPGRAPTVTLDTPIDGRDGQGKLTIADMIKEAMLAVREGDECGWSLIALTAFPEIVPPDREWDVAYASRGQVMKEKWSIERIVAMEYRDSVYPQPSSQRGIDFAIPFHETSCGGTHRLIGLSLALTRYRNYLRAQGKPVVVEGAWLDADNLIGLAIERIRELQQEDGAFSALWLQRASTSNDVTVRIRTTGHCLEFLALTLPKEELAKDWVTRAAIHLCELFEQTKDMPVDCGAAYHALHGLQVYREKRWGVAE